MFRSQKLAQHPKPNLTLEKKRKSCNYFYWLDPMKRLPQSLQTHSIGFPTTAPRCGSKSVKVKTGGIIYHLDCMHPDSSLWYTRPCRIRLPPHISDRPSLTHSVLAPGLSVAQTAGSFLPRTSASLSLFPVQSALRQQTSAPGSLLRGALPHPQTAVAPSGSLALRPSGCVRVAALMVT